MNATSGLGMLLKMSGFDPDLMLGELKANITAGVLAMESAQKSQALILQALTLQELRISRIEHKIDMLLSALPDDDTPSLGECQIRALPSYSNGNPHE